DGFCVEPDAPAFFHQSRRAHGLARLARPVAERHPARNRFARQDRRQENLVDLRSAGAIHAAPRQWQTLHQPLRGPGAGRAAGDRFYAFDKKTGELVWSSSPAGRPQDNTFSHPVLSWWNGKRVLYSAAGDCSLISLNARTGEPIWRVLTAKSGAKGGVNAAVLTYGDTIITVHESENLDSSEIGRMTSFKIPQSVTQTNPNEPAVFTPKELEVWRNSIGSRARS